MRRDGAQSNVRFRPIADIELCGENATMAVLLSPTREQPAILERLVVSEDVAAEIRQTSFALQAQDAKAIREALTLELAQCGFDADYELNAEGRLIEDLIDDLLSGRRLLSTLADIPRSTPCGH